MLAETVNWTARIENQQLGLKKKVRLLHLKSDSYNLKKLSPNLTWNVRTTVNDMLSVSLKQRIYQQDTTD